VLVRAEVYSRAFRRRNIRNGREARFGNIGFTLIELLVVIAVIAVLAGILFPVFAQAQKTAKQARCLSSLKQIAAAWTLYSNDNDGRACPSYYSTPEWSHAWDFSYGGTPRRHTDGLLGPYARNGQIKSCPSFKGEAWDRPYTGYAYNATYIGGDSRMVFKTCVFTRPPCAVSRISRPSATVVFADAGFQDGGVVSAHNYLRAPGDALFDAGTVHFRHSGAASVAYADGHVRAERKKCNVKSESSECGALSEDDSAYDLK